MASVNDFDYKRYLRDIKLDMISSRIEAGSKKDPYKVNPPKIGGLFSFMRPGNKIVREILKCGGILTGSRALKCYQFNGKPLLYRKPDDWDFIVSEKTLFKIADKYNISNGIRRDADGDYNIHFNECLIRISHSYGGESRLMDTIITLICKDEPGSVETSGGKIANLGYILGEKFKLSNASANSATYEDNKH